MTTFETIIITLLGLLLVFVVFFELKSSNERQVWLNEHCVKFAETSGSSVPTTGFSTSGNMTFGSAYIPGKTGYKCDDGIEYWE